MLAHASWAARCSQAVHLNCWDDGRQISGRQHRQEIAWLDHASACALVAKYQSQSAARSSTQGPRKDEPESRIPQFMETRRINSAACGRGKSSPPWNSLDLSSICFLTYQKWKQVGGHCSEATLHSTPNNNSTRHSYYCGSCVDASG